MRVVIKKFVVPTPDFAYINSLIAQLVERRTVNPQVPGSSPGRGATEFISARVSGHFSFEQNVTRGLLPPSNPNPPIDPAARYAGGLK